MDNWFKSKWFIRGLSLAFAIMLYIFVAIEEADTSGDRESTIPTLFGGSKETKTIEDVPLGIQIDSDTYVVSGVPETVTVSLEGTASELTPVVTQRNFEVFVDLRDLKEGEHEVEIQYDNIPKQLSVYIEPKTINVVIEKRATAEFNVSVDFVNEDKLPEGYQVGDFKLNTDKVTITSSKEVIDRIAIVKVFVDVTGLTDSIKNREVPVNVYDNQGNELGVRIDPQTVIISVDIENPSKKVPVSVATTGELPEGYRVVSMEPVVTEVEVFATTNVLDKVDKITTEPINLSELTKSGTIKVGLSLPDKVQAPGTKEIDVKVVLEQTKSITNLKLEVDNAADGNVVNFVEPENQRTSITVTGNEQDVRELSDKDFRIYINVKGLGRGKHVVPVEISGPDGVKYELEIKEATIEIEEV
ncbi:CdaR family protein [Ornithinibacillus bavariensis]|uniref:CdaA regulatory protein CdaR n=1 Tax=Ornithinibacillus bavariensis TaxID=545502 RepID=A0A919XAP1_9BACI|nr:CdaR family protein [Ornithinibacillus bavariensis]GIO27472.1 CdaA regulatory protein CdaR [Ornithinibacillus bavariensis]